MTPIGVAPWPAGEKVGVKVMVDRQKRRVVLAESGNDFVDILFSFLTMPLGTVIRVVGLNKSPSSLGSIVNLYRSLANLDTTCFWTEACKTMLLRPQNSAEVKCEDLAINIDGTKPRTFFTCTDCISESKFIYSWIPDTRCRCGKLMSQVTKLRSRRVHNEPCGDGVFVNAGSRFLITDDLTVDTPSAAVLMRTFETMEVEDVGKLEERNLELGRDEIASLLWRTLISTSPLTDLCFNTPEKEVPARWQTKDGVTQPNHGSELVDVGRNPKEIKLKLVMDKESNKLLFAEADSDMVDLLFGWLTFPLGLLAKHAKDMPSGCIGNLRKSAECNGLMKSEMCKSMLLSPKLAPFHGCSNQLLNAEERATIVKQLNPRSTINGTEAVEGYVRPSTYMVTDDLLVSPLSMQSFVQILSEFRIPAGSLVEREVCIGATQASDLLRAAFVSRTALSDVFPPAKKPRRLPYSAVH